MGSVFSKWKKKKTTVEVLEGIDKEILRLQRFRKSNQELRSRVIGNLILYSIIVYVIACAALYFLFIPSTVFERALQILPFLCFPILIYLLKRFLHWWFVRKLSKNELELQGLKDERKDILENVMETETYKKAKEILEKFDPETKRKLEEERLRREAPISPQQTPGTELRRRNIGPVSPTGPRPMYQASGSPMVTPVRSMMNTALLPNPQTPTNGLGRGQRMPFPQSLPRPLIRQNRSTMEKMVEYFVGDGPNNRYALICKNCYSHNGMALKEEFEYMEYRCAYCSFFNTARKQRPNAPRLPSRVSSPMVKRNLSKTHQNDSPNDDDSEAAASSTELQQPDAEPATNGDLSDGADDSKQFSHGDTTSVADLQQDDEIPMDEGNDEGDHDGEQEKREINEDFPSGS